MRINQTIATGALFVVLGMVGTYIGVAGSGWIIAVGLFIVLHEVV